MPMPSTSQKLYGNVSAPPGLHIAIQLELLAIWQTHFVFPLCAIFSFNLPTIPMLKPAHEFERNCGLVRIVMIA
jgi:hypothetical protein